MKQRDILIGAAVLALGVWYFKLKNAKKSSANTPPIVVGIPEPAPIKPIDAATGAPIAMNATGAGTYSHAFLQDYELVVPPFQPSAKVQAKSRELDAGRFAPNFQNIKSPIYVNDL
jgi:hypothetical protein